MAGLDTEQAIRLAARLIEVEVLASADPPCFLHPIVRAAVEASMATDERHPPPPVSLPAKLDRNGGPPGRVAAHLMHVQAVGDPRVAARLRQAARAAMNAGLPLQAGLLLRRAP